MRHRIQILSAVALALGAMSIGYASAARAADPAALAPAGLAGDVDLLVGRIEALHPNPFRKVARQKFEADAAALKQAMPGLSREQAIAGLMRLVAKVGEGHTSVPPAQPSGGFHVLPLRLQLDDGSLYVAACDRRYQRALGWTLRSINGIPASEVLPRVRPLVSGDNSFTVDGRVAGYLVVPEILKGVGIIGDATKSVPMTLVRGGREMRISVAPAVFQNSMMMNFLRAAYSNEWVDAEPAPPPLWLRHPDKPYWFEAEPATGTIFVQYNNATNDPADPMPDFARRLRKQIDDTKPSRVILDLRMNSGGEAFWNRPLLLALLRSDWLEQPGRLFVLIGPQTFSAGTLLAIDLEKYSKVVFIGQPTGGAIQNFGNHQAVRLPASGLVVLIATKYYQNDGPNDDRPFVAPQLAAGMSAADYLAGRDQAVDLAVDYRPPAEALHAALAASPADQAASIFAAFKAEKVYRYLDTEPVLIEVGYDFIHAKELPRAIATMQLATAEHPQSANAYDSLGDAYRAAGDRDAAIASYKKALAIAPEWQSSIESLKALGAPVPQQHH